MPSATFVMVMLAQAFGWRYALGSATVFALGVLAAVTFSVTQLTRGIRSTKAPAAGGQAVTHAASNFGFAASRGLAVLRVLLRHHFQQFGNPELLHAALQATADLKLTLAATADWLPRCNARSDSSPAASPSAASGLTRAHRHRCTERLGHPADHRGQQRCRWLRPAAGDARRPRYRRRRTVPRFADQTGNARQRHRARLWHGLFRAGCWSGGVGADFYWLMDRDTALDLSGAATAVCVAMLIGLAHRAGDPQAARAATIGDTVSRATETKHRNERRYVHAFTFGSF